MCVIVLFSSFLHAACISRVSSSYLIKKPWNVRSVRWHILSMRRWKKSVWDDEDMNSWRLSPEIPQLLWVIVGSGWRFSWFPALSKNKVKNKENPENWVAWIFHFFLKYFFAVTGWATFGWAWRFSWQRQLWRIRSNRDEWIKQKRSIL